LEGGREGEREGGKAGGRKGGRGGEGGGRNALARVLRRKGERKRGREGRRLEGGELFIGRLKEFLPDTHINSLPLSLPPFFLSSFLLFPPGERSKAVDYFAALGTKCPANFNPADFFIEELAVVPSEYESSMARLRGVTDAYAESDLRKANDKWFGRLSPEVLAKPRKKTGIAITEYPATAETQFWESCKVGREEGRPRGREEKGVGGWAPRSTGW